MTAVFAGSSKDLASADEVRVTVSELSEVGKPVMETARAHDRWTAADRLRCSA